MRKWLRVHADHVSLGCLVLLVAAFIALVFLTAAYQ